MIKPEWEWQAIAMAEAAKRLAEADRCSSVDRAYYTGIADIMNAFVDQAPPVWPEKLNALLDEYSDSI